MTKFVLFFRLTERNCIDIVKRLIQLKLIDVIFTSNGKEYLTSEQLVKEIENEVYAAGGRLSIADLVSILNVDYDHIEAKANHLSRFSNGEYNIVLGQLISKDYKNNMASELDLQLQEAGHLSVSEMSKNYNLPADFIMILIEERLGVYIKGKLDKDTRTLYTFDYIARYESIITGALSAITRPVALQQLANRYNVTEKTLLTTLNTLISNKRIVGIVSGSNFIPEVYSKTQQEYVNNFYRHNHYLDYSTLNKLGVSNPQSFLEKKFGKDLCYLQTCAVDPMLKMQIENEIEECVQSKSFTDLIEIMPSVLNEKDVDTLIEMVLKNNENLASSIIMLCNTIAVSSSFIDNVKKYFDDIRKTRIEEDLKSGLLLQYFSHLKSMKTDSFIDERKSKKSETLVNANKKGTKKGGAGNTQGREIKTKAVKNKYKSSKLENPSKHDEPDNLSLTFLSADRIIDILSQNLKSEVDLEFISEDFVESLTDYIIDDLQKQYELDAKESFLHHNTESMKNKKSFADIQNAVNDTYLRTILYDKAIGIFDSGKFWLS